MTDIVELLRQSRKTLKREAANLIEQLREELKRSEARADLWRDKWEAEKADHEHSRAWADKEMKRDRPD